MRGLDGVSFITTTPPPASQLHHIPLELSLQEFFEVLLGEGEADLLHRLLTLSQMHPASLSPHAVTLRSNLLTIL